MSDYQERPTPVAGYRELSQSEVALINSIKGTEDTVGQLWRAVTNLDSTDKRWAALARTHLQEGFMALVRSIARPRDPFEQEGTKS